MRAPQGGNATTETIVALLALAPFVAGIPLLGKQLDIKHKSYDATRYSVWERTVWRSDGTSNRKASEDITLEARDRTLGDPRAGMLAVQPLRTQGVTENPLWRDHRYQRLLDYESNSAPITVAHDEHNSPVDVGRWLVPGLTHGDGPLSAVATLLQVDDLGLTSRAFATAAVTVGLRPVLGRLADRQASLGERQTQPQSRSQLVQRAAGAVLSDTWSARDETNLRQRIDDVTTNEFIEALELPSRFIALHALGRGQPLFGEGQFGWDPDLRPSSATLPAAYIGRTRR